MSGDKSTSSTRARLIHTRGNSGGKQRRETEMGKRRETRRGTGEENKEGDRGGKQGGKQGRKQQLMQTKNNTFNSKMLRWQNTFVVL